MLRRRLMMIQKASIEEETSPVEMFNFTGVDANGLYEGEVGYTTPTEYAIGGWQYEYYKIIEPTPTTKEEVVGKYYYDGITGAYVQATSSVVDGTLPGFTLGTTKVYDKLDTIDTATHSFKVVNEFNNGLNSEYFGGINLGNSYTSEEEILDGGIDISSIILPSVYKNLPITTILPNAFRGSYSYSNGKSYWILSKTKHFKLGKNITTLLEDSINRVCSYVDDDIDKSFELNSKLKHLGVNSLLGVYGSTSNIILPKSVENIGAGVFYDTVNTDGENCRLLNTITLLSDFTSTGTSSPIDKNCKYLIIESSVHNISGDLGGSSNIVFKHGADDEVNLNLNSLKYAASITIYTDNDMVKAYDWATQNYTVTFYPLSDYTGG